MVQRIIKSVVVLAVSLLLLQLSGAFHTPSVQADTQEKAVGLPVPSHRATVTVCLNSSFREEVGTVSAATSVQLAPEVGGRIWELTVDVGDEVHAGQVVARIDDREAKLRVAQANSAFAAATAKAKQAAAAYARTSALFNKEAATREMLENAEAQDAQSNAAVDTAAQQLAQANLFLGYHQIISPIEGKVLMRHADPGDLAAPGRPLLSLQGEGPLEFDAEVRAGLIDYLHLGQNLSIRFETLGQTALARVTEIRPSADPQSRSVPVTLSLENSEGLRAGVFGRLQIPTGEDAVLAIPRKAVETIGQLQMTLVQNANGLWGRRNIRLGHNLEEGQVIVLSGLEEGEVIGWNE